MKKSFIYLLFLTFLFSLTACDQTGKQSSDNIKKAEIPNIDYEKAKVSELLEILATGTESGNMSMVEKIWCPKEETMLIGTENDEKLVGWSQIREAIGHQSAEFSDILISITDQNIWMDNDAKTAWFFEELNYNFIYRDKAMSFDGIRFTGVFVKSAEGEWKLVQGHMSVPSTVEIQ